ncbi:MAG: YqaE/Pmp3 family membrane protein [Bacteroidales bacterium]
MNRKNSKLMIASVMLLGVIFSSCSLTKDNNFNTRKYTHFKKGETCLPDRQATVVINSSKKEINSEIKPVQITCNEITDISEKSVAIISQTAVPVPAGNFQQEIYPKSNIKTADANTELLTKTTKEKVKRTGSYVMNHFVNNATRTSVIADDNDLLLCIIAILLPPLAVYLVRGIGNDFWIDVLLTLLFWIPGVIYALLVILDTF